MRNVTEARNAQECMDAAGLNYTLALEPVYIAGRNKVDGIPVQGQEVKGKFAVVRQDTGSPLGIVGKRYEIVQNAQVFGFFDGIVEQGLGKYKEAYSVAGGAKVNVVCDLGEFDIGGDTCRKELVLRTSHDGSCAVTGIMRVMRLVCTNGLMAMRNKTTIKIRHTQNYHAKMAQARDTLGIAEQYYRWFSAQATKLVQTPVSHATALQIIKGQIMPAPDPDNVSTKMQNAWEGIYNRFLSGRGNHGKNLWDLYNGLTEYVDHQRSSGRKSETERETNLVGSGAKLKERTFELLAS